MRMGMFTAHASQEGHPIDRLSAVLRSARPDLGRGACAPPCSVHWPPSAGTTLHAVHHHPTTPSIRLFATSTPRSIISHTRSTSNTRREQKFHSIGRKLL